MHIARGPASSRRLLLISYHFPPALTAGALRWQKMAAFLSEQGWCLDVVSLGSASGTDEEESPVDSLPPGTRVYPVPRRTSAGERLERHLYGLRNAVRRMGRRATSAAPRAGSEGARGGDHSRPSSIPPEEIRWQWNDPRAYTRVFHSWLDFTRQGTWARDAAALGTALASRRSYDMVATSGPPHMAHVAGAQVARAAGAPLLLDFRDPWSLRRRLPEPIASPAWFWFAQRQERRVIREAALIVTNTDAVREALGQLYPHRRDSMVTVMNGSDEDRVPESGPRDRFLVIYAGGIYLDRNPSSFFQGSAAMVRHLGLTPDQFHVLFVGNVQSYGAVPVQSMAEAAGLSGYVTLLPPMGRLDLLELLASASMLLSLPQDSKYAIPSKVFEYMQFNAWVLALAKPDSPTARALAGTDADVVDPDQPDAIADVLGRRYLQFAGGEKPARPDPKNKLSRKHQAAILLDAMEKAVSKSPNARK
jgi:hypothetical protein